MLIKEAAWWSGKNMAFGARQNKFSSYICICYFVAVFGVCFFL